VEGMKATPPSSWLPWHITSTISRLEPPSSATADIGTSALPARAWLRVLPASLYLVASICVHLCAWASQSSHSDTWSQQGLTPLWMGVLWSQLLGLVLWRPEDHAIRLWRAPAALVGLACGVHLSQIVLAGPIPQWWFAMTLMILVTIAANWALHRPEAVNNRLKARDVPRCQFNFSVQQWMVGTVWVAIFMATIQSLPHDLTLLAGLSACFGGLGIWVAIHRFAYEQLLWPAWSHPATAAHRQVLAANRQDTTFLLWRGLDAAGILLILGSMHGLLLWGLTQYYQDSPTWGVAYRALLAASLWPWIDLALEHGLARAGSGKFEPQRSGGYHLARHPGHGPATPPHQLAATLTNSTPPRPLT
jgi:hypothetical protein